MNDAELQLLRDVTLGPVRGERAGDHVRVVASAAVVSQSGGSWQHDVGVLAEGWVDNLKNGTVMIYGRSKVWAIRFSQIESVSRRSE